MTSRVISHPPTESERASASLEIASRIAAATRSNDDAVSVPGLEESGVETYRIIEERRDAKGIDLTLAFGGMHPPASVLPPSEWSPTEGKPVESTIGQPKAANSDVVFIPQLATSCPGFTIAPANDNYTTLRAILDAAFSHAATGKGKERHARDLPFDEQPMLETTRLVGPGFPLGQAIKKAGEAAGMIERSEYGAAEAECLGAINYLAGAVAWMREQKEGKVAA